MKSKSEDILNCDLCNSPYHISDPEIAGIKQNSNGRHIARESPNSRGAKAHVCKKCIESILNENCNFHYF